MPYQSSETHDGNACHMERDAEINVRTLCTVIRIFILCVNIYTDISCMRNVQLS